MGRIEAYLSLMSTRQEAMSYSFWPWALKRPEYMAAVDSDLQAMSNVANTVEANLFFNQHWTAYPFSTEGSHLLKREIWLLALEAVRSRRPDLFPSIHKGTAFFYTALFSFLADDFSRAHLYLMAAFAEDEVNHGHVSVDSLAAKFLLLEDAPILSQTGMFHYNQGRVLHALRGFRARMPGAQLELDELRSRFLRRAVDISNTSAHSFRPAAAALLSFILEHDNCKRDLTLTSTNGAPSELPFMHLFKGCVLLETLLKLAPVDKGLTTPTGDLKDLLTFHSGRKDLQRGTIPNPSQFRKAKDLNEILGVLMTTPPPYGSNPAWPFEVAAELRNKIGHSVGLPSLGVAQYEGLFSKVLDALLWTICRLY